MKCKCGAEFEPMTAYNSTIKQKQCLQCLIKNGNEKRKKIERADWRKEKAETKAKLKTHSEWLKDLQSVFNAYIRERDAKKPCISCDKPLINKFDAGHFFSVGAYPNIRFNEDNVHGQCVFCNQHRHGATNEYAIRLPYRIGQERYDKLLIDRNESNKFTVAEIKEKIAYYKLQIKKLQFNRGEQTEQDKISNLF